MKSQFKRGQYTLSRDQSLNIINSTKSFRDRVILKFLYFAGLRAFEVINLKIEDIDIYSKVINVYGKGQKVRTVPFIDSGFYSDVKFYISDKKPGKLFSISKRQAQWVCQNAGARAGIPNPNPLLKHINAHLFRHSIARQLKSDGYPAEFIQNFLGHSSIETTMDTYGTLNLHEMQKMILSRTGDNLIMPTLKYTQPELISH